MRILKISTVLSSVLLAGAFSVTAQAHYRSASQIQLAANGTTALRNYDPYASGLSPCPQGSPNGGVKKCRGLIPHSGRET